MKKALLINKGWADNFGDQLIKYSLEYLLKENNYTTDFLDFTEEKKTVGNSYKSTAKIEKNKEIKISFKRKIFRKALNNNFFKNIIWLYKNPNLFKIDRLKKDYNIVIIGGGQLILSDSTFPLAMYKWIKILKYNNSQSEIILFGVGSEGKFDFIERFLYSKSLKKLDRLYIRDYESIKLLKDQFNLESEYTPDVGFYISKAYKLDYKKEKKVLIGITDFLVYKRYNKDRKSKEEYYLFWENEIVNYMEEGFEVELFYTTVRDLVESVNLKAVMLKKYGINVKILYVDTLKELIHEIAKSSVLISGRMHGLIIGYSYNCNVVPYVISNKVKSFKEQYIDTNIDINLIQTDIETKFKKATMINKDEYI